MRRTLTVAALAAAMLVPAAAASAAPGPNASCSNGKTGNKHQAVYNGEGNTAKAALACGDDAPVVSPVLTPPPVEPKLPEGPSEVG